MKMDATEKNEAANADVLVDEQQMQKLAAQCWPPAPASQSLAMRQKLLELRSISQQADDADDEHHPQGDRTAVQSPVDSQQAPDEPIEHDRIEHYQIVGEIGQGGMGVVYRARDEKLQRTVAIKILRADRNDPESRRRVLREAQAAAKIDSDRVVRVYAVAKTSQGVPCLVMQFIEGPTLAERLHDASPLDPCEAALLLAEAAEGLAAVHRHGLVHRDIKPGNILIDEDGRAKITDFGMVRRSANKVRCTQTGAIPGTPEYMSPEQIRSPEMIDARSDVYSLGVTLYEALTGDVPFHGSPHSVLRQIVEEEPRPLRFLNDQLPRDLETIALRAMEKDRERRYAGAQELADDLRRWLRGEPIHARPVGKIERTFRWCRRRPGLAGLLATLLLAITLGFAGVTWQWQRAERQRSIADAQQQRADSERQFAVQMQHRAERTLRAMRKERRLKQAVQAEADEQRFQANQARSQLIDSVFQLQITQDPTREGVQRKFSESLHEALETMAERYGDDPKNHPHAAAAHAAVGAFQRKAGQREQAVRSFRKAYQLFREQIEKQNAAAQVRQSLAICCRNLGELLAETDQNDDARDFHREACEHAELLVQTYPRRPNHRLELAQCLTAAAAGNMAVEKTAETVELLDRASRTLDAFNESPYEIIDYRFVVKLARLHHRLGVLQLEVGNPQAAPPAFQQSAATWKDFLERMPRSNMHRSDVAETYESLGQVLLTLNREVEASREFATAAEHRQAAKQPPSRASQSIAKQQQSARLQAAEKVNSSFARQIQRQPVRLRRTPHRASLRVLKAKGRGVLLKPAEPGKAVPPAQTLKNRPQPGAIRDLTEPAHQ